MKRIAFALALVALPLLPAAVQAQADSPEELVLRTQQALDLTNQALEDVLEPVGGLLGRISPSSSFATANRGFGYLALSVGATGMEFEVTNPDYTDVGPNGEADVVNGPSGAFFADLEIGLFSGFGRTTRAKNVGSVDLLLRLGATLGDQDDLGEEIQFGNWKPIYGAGARIGLLRGERLPSVSFAFGVNHFAERSFHALGDVDGQEVAAELNFEQTSTFYLLEIGKQWGFVLPYAGVGRVQHVLDANYSAEIVTSGGDATTLADAVSFDEGQASFFGGFELGSGIFRFVLEAGSVAGSPYGTVFLKLIPLPGY